MPVVIRSVVGAGGRFGAIHSQMPASWFMGVPGIKIAAPSNPADAKALLRAAIEDDNPVLFFEHKRLYGIQGDVERRHGDTRSGGRRARGPRRHARLGDEGRPRLPRGRRDARCVRHRGRGDRPAHAAAARRRHRARVRREDEPPRRGRRGAADGRLGRRGARARDRARPRRPRRRVAHHDARHAGALQPAARGRASSRDRRASPPRSRGACNDGPDASAQRRHERPHRRRGARRPVAHRPATARPPRARRTQPARARPPHRRLGEPDLADRARQGESECEHALLARPRARPRHGRPVLRPTAAPAAGRDPAPQPAEVPRVSRPSAGR